MSVVTGVPASAATAPTEASPLLAERQDVNDIENAPSAYSGGGNEGGGGQDDRMGNPEMLKRLHLLIPAVGIGLFLVAIDQLLIIASYAKIGSELRALNNISWIATSYFITLTSFQPLYGKLSDIFGRKECLLFAYAVFGLGCLGCGLAQDMIQLCVSRAIAGIGGGGMTSVVSILMSDIVPLRDRGIWQGYINLIFASGTSTGAPLGGFLADSIGWRWSFIAQAPLCLIAWVAVYFVLDIPRPSHDHWLVKVRQIDFLGAFTLILAVIALLVGLDSGSNLGWSHNVTISSLALAPALLALFVFVEIKIASHPFAPGHIIFHRGLVGPFLANFFGVAGNFGVLFFLPLYFQVVHKYNATISGALLVPGLVATVMASIGGGWVMRRTGKFYWITFWAHALMLFGVAPLLAGLWFKMPVLSEVGLVLHSLGAGCFITTTLVALLANASVDDSAIVVACSYLFRSLGSSLGIGIGSAVLQQTLRSQLAQRLTNGDDARRIEDAVRQNIDFINKLPPLLAAQVRDSYRYATMGAFVPTVIFLMCAFVVSIWVKEKPLKK